MDKEKQYDIFISYSSKDKDTVQRYVSALESEGYKIWWDEKGITSGEFSTIIVNAIKNSKLLLFFSSEHSNKSQWTKGEILVANNNNIPIIPVKLDDADYDDSIVLLLLPLQYADLRHCNFTEGKEKIKKAVDQELGEKITDPLPPKERKHTTANMVISTIFSIVASCAWLWVSGEVSINKSLALFATFMGALMCIISSGYITYFSKEWVNRKFMVNTLLTQGTNVFLSFITIAIGLSFVDVKIIKLHFPSVIVATVALCAMYRVINKQKYGIKMLWACVVAFSIGSLWWVEASLKFPVIIAVAGIAAMATLMYILRND